MKISSSLENNKSSPKQSFKGIPKNPRYLPNIVGKIGKAAGEYISMPEQKLFLAATALMFRPLIDLKYADEDKKNDAAIKSAAKAIAGGITGVTIRAAFLKITDHFIGFDKHNKLNMHFFPDKAKEMLQDCQTPGSIPVLAAKRMKQYQNTLGTLFAILFMTFFSNSKVDVPLTSDIQDLITGVVKENKSWIKSISDVTRNRKNKIKNWINTRKDNIINVGKKVKQIINVIRSDDNEEVKEPNK